MSEYMNELGKFFYSSCWHHWSRIIAVNHLGFEVVEVDLTPHPGQKWSDVAKINIRVHCTSRRYNPCPEFPLPGFDQLVDELPSEMVAEMQRNLGPALTERLLKEDFYSQIDWKRYEKFCNGGASFEDARKRVPKSVSGSSKKFDLHGWDYSGGREQVRSFLLRLPVFQGDEQIADGFLGYLDECGGKAFGRFMIAALLDARKCHNFRTPNSVTISPRNSNNFSEAIAQWLSQVGYPDNLIVRSSADNEDWIDPRSGVHKSKKCWVRYVDEVVQETLKTQKSLLVQERCYGIGFVVDVGYSEILHRPVVRIAHGNNSKTGDGIAYTSATWDHEAQVGLYEADIEKAIVSLERKEFAPVGPVMAHDLAACLEEAGIDFGVQFEIVIDPAHNSRWWLVQMRPSPENVRGMQELPKFKGGSAIATTGAINRAGLAEGELVCLRKDDEPKIAREEIDLKGKIVLWESIPTYGFSNLFIMANEQGAVGHLSHEALFKNSGHGTFAEWNELAQGEYEEAVRGALTMTIDRKAAEQLRTRARKGNIRMRLVADGLVGRAYVL